MRESMCCLAPFERFWIQQGRQAVGKVESNCVRCKCHTAKRLESTPVHLHEDQVKDAAVFEIVGVDLAGPLFLKDGTKAWIVLYTCAVYRAVIWSGSPCCQKKPFYSHYVDSLPKEEDQQLSTMPISPILSARIMPLEVWIRR